MNTQIPMPVNGISTPFSIDENIAKMKQTLLKDIQRSAYVYRVDCGGCNGCEIEIFSTITPTFDAERFGIKVVASPRQRLRSHYSSRRFTIIYITGSR